MTYLNVKKSKHIKFTRNKNIINSNYKLNGEVVDEVENIRDLGVQFDKKLNFIHHIDEVVLKASKMLGFVLRQCKNFKKPSTKKIMYNSLVRSHLEYCSIVWSPGYSVHVARIERVQKRFLWHLAFSCNMGKKLKSYRDRLKYFGMASLERRRRMIDLVFLKKLVVGNFNCPDLLSKVSFHLPRGLPRKSNRKLFCTPKGRTNLRRHSSLSRMYALYKDYEEAIDLCVTSLYGLKKAVLTEE